MVTCTYKVKARSTNACYVFSLNSLFRYISKYFYLFGIILIIPGLFIGFFGRKLFKPTICIVGTIAFILLSSYLLFTISFDRDSSEVA